MSAYSQEATSWSMIACDLRASLIEHTVYDTQISWPETVSVAMCGVERGIWFLNPVVETAARLEGWLEPTGLPLIGSP